MCFTTVFTGVLQPCLQVFYNLFYRCSTTVFTGVLQPCLQVFYNRVYRCSTALLQVTEDPLDLPVTEDLWVFLDFQDLRDHREDAVRTPSSDEHTHL